MLKSIAALALLFAVTAARAQDVPPLATTEGDFTVRDFHFRSGETLDALRLHYTTLGTPVRDARGRVTNAVLILHGTGGDGHQFLRPQFSGVLFVAGGLLDARKYFIILPDGIGHGKSSKPSDGLHAHFPHYDYDDTVAAQYALVTKGLHVNHLRLVGHVHGLHAFFRLGRDLSHIHRRRDATCLPASRDRRAQPDVAQDDHRCD
jgi:homoserine O-acetyltransferase/O-succinyltransferase